MWTRLIWVVLIAAVSGCATERASLNVSPLASGNQDIVAIEDLRIIRSSNRGVTVWAWTDRGFASPAKCLSIEISFENRTEDSITIDPGRFSAHDGVGNPIGIMTAEDYQAALGRTVDRGPSGSPSSSFGSSLPNEGVGIHTGNVGEETYSGEMKQADVQRGRGRQAETSNPYWLPTGLSPGQSGAGHICLVMNAQTSPDFQLVLDVRVADWKHAFLFDVRTDPSPR